MLCYNDANTLSGVVGIECFGEGLIQWQFSEAEELMAQPLIGYRVYAIYQKFKILSTFC